MGLSAKKRQGGGHGEKDCCSQPSDTQNQSWDNLSMSEQGAGKGVDLCFRMEVWRVEVPESFWEKFLR